MDDLEKEKSKRKKIQNLIRKYERRSAPGSTTTNNREAKLLGMSHVSTLNTGSQKSGYRFKIKLKSSKRALNLPKIAQNLVLLF
jgi:hypothetical protein